MILFGTIFQGKFKNLDLPSNRDHGSILTFFGEHLLVEFGYDTVSIFWLNLCMISMTFENSPWISIFEVFHIWGVIFPRRSWS